MHRWHDYLCRKSHRIYNKTKQNSKTKGEFSDYTHGQYRHKNLYIFLYTDNIQLETEILKTDIYNVSKERNFHDLEVGKEFLNVAPKEGAIKE